ncbi:S8 family peptidase [Shewanella sp. JM162201]|uniref:S8 family peptidase n=1 Tax=Shewanella jiangmenensis TaxID=2837387 RepID=A0ABS5V4T2_9GAMM|nr:S8 family peptidase [Shewanella jiangmenensis]MBT1445476.1 S8 family peptidase [Shewanella jiangmenensis]
MNKAIYKKHAIAVLVAGCFTSQWAVANEYQANLVKVPAERAIKDNYIVVFNTPSVLNLQDGNALESFATAQGHGLENNYGIAVKSHFGSALNGVLVTATPAQIKQMLRDPSVKYIEQDQLMSVSPQVAASGDQGGATWGLDRIDQRNLPLNGNYHYDYDGSGVTAYVIDTGVLTSHNEFGGRASHGWDFVDNDADATDCNGHGTHVAGTIGGGSYGVAKNVNLVGVRVLGCAGTGSNSGVINGINWVKNNAFGPSVANMSLGGGASQATDDAVNSAVAAGITFVVAAGNDNANACNYSPARAANAITVGSTTSSDARSSFSNYGSCLDIYAPGSSIKSAWYTSNSATNTISGTSMASPHVAGVAALYLAETPGLSPSQITSRLASRATSSKVTDAKTGSPNKLLYSLADTTTTPPGGSCTDANCLSSGVPVTGLSGASGSSAQFKLYAQAGTVLNVSIGGGSGDADLYVKAGSQPTTSSYDCRPYRNGNSESCSLSVNQSGFYYVMLRGYTSYSGVTLQANF